MLEYGRVMLTYTRVTDHTSFAYTAAPWPQWLINFLTTLAFLGFAALWFRFSFFRPGKAPSRTLRQWWPCARRYLWLAFVAYAGWTVFFHFVHRRIWFEVLWRFHPRDGVMALALGQAIYLLVFVTITARLSFLLVSAAVDEDWPRPAKVWASAKGQTLPIIAAFTFYSLLLALLKYLIIVLPDSLDLHFFTYVVGNPYRSFAAYVGDRTWWLAAETFVGCLGIAWLIGFIGRRYRQSVDRQSMTRDVEAF